MYGALSGEKSAGGNGRALFILLINIRVFTSLKQAPGAFCSGGLAFARAYAGAKALHNFSEGNPFVLEFLSHDKLWYNEIAQNKSYIFL